MASVTGFGGIFLRADDPKALYQRHERYLGLVKAEGHSDSLPQRSTLRLSLPFSSRTMRTSLLRRKRRSISRSTTWMECWTV